LDLPITGILYYKRWVLQHKTDTFLECCANQRSHFVTYMWSCSGSTCFSLKAKWDLLLHGALFLE